MVGNEDRDVWKIYLEKGEFDTALRYAKVKFVPFLSFIHIQRCDPRQLANATRLYLHRQKVFSLKVVTIKLRNRTPVVLLRLRRSL